MKRVNYLFVMLAALSLVTACKNINYKKTKSGLLYKIFPGNGKDSLIRNGNVVKFNFIFKLNDSVLYSSYGKLPGYQGIMISDRPSYNLLEILPLMRKGDSAVTVQSIDSLMKQGANVPPNAQKGDRLVTMFRVTEVFRADSLARIDYSAEMEKDRPRAMKEQEELKKKEQEQQAEEVRKQVEKYEQSGEAAKEIKEMESWLAGKKINAKKFGHGTYVSVQEEGTGPAVAVGKYVNVKYTGKVLATDSVFQSSSYAIKLGTDPLIQGWNEGLIAFKQGGKGTLYIPGFVAYGENPGPARKPFAPLVFDIEILEVSDNPIAQQPQQPAR